VHTDNDVSSFDAMCRFWSDHFDVVNNENFANLVPEYGYEGNINNFAQYHSQLTEHERNALFEKRNKSIRAFYDTPAGDLEKLKKSLR
jgi:hypothetical protein